MSYQVLARKWRPRIFREMVGQEHVLQALINALDHNRLHHAYLFTGTRGVGKTTIARILAKCLNCETGVSSEPCGQCSACVELAEGRFIDLIEVDAASRTKVEDTRELLENVQYAPTRGRYKVYLIDEVHMLSNSSFNALLKTLEEPPPHVKFLLATTDPQKLPVTVLSRCLQFNLKNMNPERIVSHLQFVLEKEMVPFEESALWQLGRSADGSMRDALSLTDQAIAFGSGKITESDVRTMLGTIDRVLVYDILQALVSLDGKAVLAAVERLSELAPDYGGALAELLSVLHRIAIAQALPEAVDNSRGDRQQVLQLAQALATEDVQLFYQTALLGRRDLPLAPDPRSGFEMVLLRMLAFKPQGVHDVPTQTLAAAQVAVPEKSMTAGADTATADTSGVEPPPVGHQEGARHQTGAAMPWDDKQNEPVQNEPINVKKFEAAPVATGAAAALAVLDTDDHSADSSIANSKITESRLSDELSAKSVVNSVADSVAESIAEPVVKPIEVKPVAELAVEKPVEASIAAPVASTPPVVPIASSINPQPLAIPSIETSEVEVSGSKAVLNSISLEQLMPAHWPQIYLALKVGGVLQSTVSNCQLVGRQGNVLQFVLDQNNSTLFDESHQQRLSDLLSVYFSVSVQAQISLGQVTLETPSVIAARGRRERMATAVKNMKTDPIVRQLIEHFSAVLDESSVQPVN